MTLKQIWSLRHEVGALGWLQEIVHQSSECVHRPDWSHWKRNWNSVSSHYHLATDQRYEFRIKHLYFSFALCRFPDLDFHIRQMKNSRVCIIVSSYKAHKWDKMFNMQSKGDSSWDSCKKGSIFLKLRFYRDALPRPRPQTYTPCWIQC